MAQEIPTTTGFSLAGWSCSAQRPDLTHPDQLSTGNNWLPAPAPGTVASALYDAAQWNITKTRDFDAEDWWYCTTFDKPPQSPDQLCHLCFDGLATLAEVWLNGHLLLTTDNMFRGYRVDVSRQLQGRNDLTIRFRSVAEELKKKRPRPQWKTNLVNHQQLRWLRTSLLGRIPGWSPPVPIIGPWRPVRLETGLVIVSRRSLSTSVLEQTGVVKFQAQIHCAKAGEPRATLQVGGHEHPAKVEKADDGWLLTAQLRLPQPPLWWPHTHGEQPLLPAVLHIYGNGQRHTFPLGEVGFRDLRVDQSNGFSVHVNGVPVYCRGACWTVSDIVTPGAAPDIVERDLRLAKDAGINMLRVGGPFVYESDHFYRLCDELGLMVWQDFMFANMDYPVEDPDFAANIEAEANYQLTRLSAHPCLAVYCGNSEIEQQAAMRGVPRAAWRNRWFGNRLPELCAQYSPETAYVPSSPSGGALPFHVGTGVAHYYGVGAYLRSPRELRSADVKFASECLAFANIPGPEAVAAVMGDSTAATHDPRWKQRVPRDTGAGWDFEDVRDFYVQHLYGVDPVHLRCFDMNRYLQLSRVATGEMMAQVFAEWRSSHGNNHGGLVWFFKDLWPGAGWGIVDSLGIPKAAYYYLRRSWQPRQITMTDEGLDGLHLHVTNETDKPLPGFVELLLLKDDHIVVARQEVPCQIAPRGRQQFASDELLEGFYDVTHAYRFGSPHHDVVIATLFDAQHQVLTEAFHFVQQREPAFLPGLQLEAEAVPTATGCYEVTLCSDRFLRSVGIEAKGFLPDDSAFHLCPGRKKVVRFTARHDPNARFRPTLEALNLKNPVLIKLRDTPA